jgi:hypothetical protein
MPLGLRNFGLGKAGQPATQSRMKAPLFPPISRRHRGPPLANHGRQSMAIPADTSGGASMQKCTIPNAPFESSMFNPGRVGTYRTGSNKHQ